MTTCPKCGRVIEVNGSGVSAGGFHICTSKSPCTVHYSCNCLKEKIAELEAKIAMLRKAIEPFADLGKSPTLRTAWVNAKRAYEESV